MNQRKKDSGVVLVVLAIAGGLMVLLISSQEAALDRIARAADASVVTQIAMGAEASVVDALRRDLDDAPETDHFNEPWARSVIQDEVLLPTGRFSVQITDLQAKFDVNLLMDVTAGTQDFARRLMVAVEQPPEMANRIARVLAAIGPVAKLEDLENYGVTQETLSAIAPHVTALPVPGTINLNSVNPFLLNVMLKNRSQTAQLIRTRESRGALSREALHNVGALRPQNSGFTSNAYLVDILATAGEAQIRMQSVVVRRNARGEKAVEIVERRFLYEDPDIATN
ncbi:general secretion pathway protein GspK [Sulfitobacter pacificus]|uniref:Type II secretion system protein K n=1 Tax=Sulfitobacter pacificus TaxID=1499314 RepID=A0ABQ5VRF8_9RHOB|nr:type II secretion system protein GspK [Sulfitobacter pacificus]GLQ29493.1 hypothetical protein GCM10007927_42970 [Sulfitobacter pacificus]